MRHLEMRRWGEKKQTTAKTVRDFGEGRSVKRQLRERFMERVVFKRGVGREVAIAYVRIRNQRSRRRRRKTK